MIHDAVLRACGRPEEIKEGVLQNPLTCHFKYGTLLCKGADSPSCLTAPKVATMHIVSYPVKNPCTGEDLFAGAFWGTEMDLDILASSTVRTTQTDLFTYIVFNDPNWNPMTFDIAKIYRSRRRQMSTCAWSRLTKT